MQNLKLMNSLIWSSLLRVLNMIRSGRWLESSVITMEVRGETDSLTHLCIRALKPRPLCQELEKSDMATLLKLAIIGRVISYF